MNEIAIHDSLRVCVCMYVFTHLDSLCGSLAERERECMSEGVCRSESITIKPGAGGQPVMCLVSQKSGVSAQHHGQNWCRSVECWRPQQVEEECSALFPHTHTQELNVSIVSSHQHKDYMEKDELTLRLSPIPHNCLYIVTLGLHWTHYRGIKSTCVKVHLKDRSIFLGCWLRWCSHFHRW